MATRSIKKKRERDDGSQGTPWTAVREQAPSVMRADQPTVARILAIGGLVCVCIGGLAVLAPMWSMNYLVPVGWGLFLIAFGTCFLLYHAFTDKDVQYRRMYGLLGGLLLATGVIARLVPGAQGLGHYFLPLGAPAMVAALLFLMTFIRNETDEMFRSRTIVLIGLMGALNAVVGFVGGFWNENFLLGQGVTHLILGLLYLWAYVALEGGAASDRGYLAGWALAGVGAAASLLSLGIYFGPQLLYSFGLTSSRRIGSRFVPGGLLLLYMGVEYLLLGLSISCDLRIVVLTRRELQAYFFSPIAYIVLVGLTLVGWFLFVVFFLNMVVVEAGNPRAMPAPEPIFAWFAGNWFPIICLIFMIPVLTMRLMSEEKRTGTLEVMLTAPVNETPAVLAKFLAAWRFYMLCWYPWALFFLALRVEGGQEFDFRPMLTFFISLAAIGAGFLGAMGLFFSSLTSNQIAAAILTFAGMMFWTSILFLKSPRFISEVSPLYALVDYVSYIDVWLESSRGQLQPRKLLFHASAAVFWIFLTIKVVESRKWS